MRDATALRPSTFPCLSTPAAQDRAWGTRTRPNPPGVWDVTESHRPETPDPCVPKPDRRPSEGPRTEIYIRKHRTALRASKGPKPRHTYEHSHRCTRIQNAFAGGLVGRGTYRGVQRTSRYHYSLQHTPNVQRLSPLVYFLPPPTPPRLFAPRSRRVYVTTPFARSWIPFVGARPPALAVSVGTPPLQRLSSSARLTRSPAPHKGAQEAKGGVERQGLRGPSPAPPCPLSTFEAGGARQRRHDRRPTTGRPPPSSEWLVDFGICQKIDAPRRAPRIICRRTDPQ